MRPKISIHLPPASLLFVICWCLLPSWCVGDAIALGYEGQAAANPVLEFRSPQPKAGAGADAGKTSNQGFANLIERYVPEFLGINRGIIGRASGDQEELSDDNPFKGNVGFGESQYFSIPQKTLAARALGHPDPGVISGEKGTHETRNDHASQLSARQALATVYISLNVCAQPSSSSGSDTGLNALGVFVSNSSQNQKPSVNKNVASFTTDQGYGQQLTTSTDGIYITVQAPPETSYTGNFIFEITVSTKAYYATFNETTFLTNTTTPYLDSDSANALIFTPNITNHNTSSDEIQKLLAGSPPFSIFVENQNQTTFKGLERSMCALKGLAPIQGTQNVQNTMSRAGDGLVRQQLYVQGLNKSSSYTAVLALNGNSTITSSNGSNSGSTVFPAFNFTTKSDSNCAIVHDLEFCTDVAYAVPTNPEKWSNVTALGQHYDQYAANSYIAFNKSLAQIPCNTTSSAQYSLARNCTDCADAYKRWLCAVTIPKCEDFSKDDTYLLPRGVPNVNLTEQFPNNPAFNPEQKSVQFTNGSRNPMIDDDIQPGPYKEVLPCIDLCYGLVQSCPANLQFACPLEGYGLSYVYGRPPQCNSLKPQASVSNSLAMSKVLCFLMILMTLTTM